MRYDHSDLEFGTQQHAAAVELIRMALREDLAQGEDLTTVSLVAADASGRVRVVAREPGVLAGSSVARMVFSELDSAVEYAPLLSDGARLEPGSVIADVSGPVRSLLTGERTALNFLTLLSGTATLTRKFVDAVAGSGARILDTRKTLPGLRALQKYAVRCGGGENHRFGLYDAVLIKDNHLDWWRSGSGPGEGGTGQSPGIADAVRQCRAAAGSDVLLEVEVDSLEELMEVLPAAPDVVLLDNMSPDQLREAVRLRNENAPTVQLEASGGITLDGIKVIASTGVERISSGALTHSAPALDIGFDWG
jgi:nicotinate-nucleotide pyrophosphorylase (carboxylating)